MTTEARLRRQSVVAYVFLCWYSIALAVFSLLDLSQKFRISNFSVISASVSIVMLAASMFVYGERYNERADQFKSCYLKLKALYESALTNEEKAKKYSEILELYENQSDVDYDNMMFDAYIRGQKLYNAAGPVIISWPTFINVIFGKLVRLVAIGALFLIPVAFFVLWVHPV